MTKEKLENAITELLEMIRDYIISARCEFSDDYEQDYEIHMRSTEIRKIVDNRHMALFIVEPTSISVAMIVAPDYMDRKDDDKILLDLGKWDGYMTEEENGYPAPIEDIIEKIKEKYKIKEIEIW